MGFLYSYQRLFLFDSNNYFKEWFWIAASFVFQLFLKVSENLIDIPLLFEFRNEKCTNGKYTNKKYTNKKYKMEIESIQIKSSISF